ncbi:MAG TPA: hypothetical protein VLL97_01635, partial [Acidobacteriota bacterium]|nr:hypothetical protein [Acidobacteriota bacterium]
SCLRACFEEEIRNKWKHLQLEKDRRIPRPKLGSILMQTAFVTREQLDEAVRLQHQTGEGRIGEWLLRLGAVEEHQITEALAFQYGIPVINLKNATASSDAVRMIPGKIARCSGLVPVNYDDSREELRIAVSGPVNFNSQEAIRRMIKKGIVTYIGDQSAIRNLLEQYYEPADLDLTGIPAFSSLEELVEICNATAATAIEQRALDINAELAQDFFWIRIDFPSEAHHYFYRFVAEPQRRAEVFPKNRPLEFYAGAG